MKTKHSSLENNLKLMSLNSIFGEPLLWGPVLITAMTKLGHVSLPWLYTMEAYCIFLTFICDVPTGALSDIFGRKKMLIIAKIMLFISFLFFAFMTAPWHIVVGNAFWAFGAAFQSGTDKSLIQETVIALEREWMQSGKWDGKLHSGYYRKYVGKIQGWRYLTVGLLAPFAGWLASINLRLPLLVSIPGLLVSIYAVSRLKEPTRSLEESGLGDGGHGCSHIKKVLAKMKEGFMMTMKDRRLIWFIFCTCVIGVASKLWFFTYNPYQEMVGVKVEDFGYVFLALNLVAFVFSKWGHVLEKMLGVRMTFGLLFALIGVPLILMGCHPVPAMVYMVVCQNVVRGMFGPFTDDVTRHYLDDRARATTLSVSSSFRCVAETVGLLFFGWILGFVSLPMSLIMLGSAVLLAMVVLLSVWSKVFGTSARNA